MRQSATTDRRRQAASIPADSSVLERSLFPRRRKLPRRTIPGGFRRSASKRSRAAERFFRLGAEWQMAGLGRLRELPVEHPHLRSAAKELRRLGIKLERQREYVAWLERRYV